MFVFKLNGLIRDHLRDYQTNRCSKSHVILTRIVHCNRRSALLFCLNMKLKSFVFVFQVSANDKKFLTILKQAASPFGRNLCAC